MPSSAYNRKASAPQTDSMDLMKINNVTSNVKPAEPSKTNKVTKVVTIVQYTANNQIKPSGRDSLRNEMQRSRRKEVNYYLVRCRKFLGISPTNFLY